jgi:hypothetical protein
MIEQFVQRHRKSSERSPSLASRCTSSTSPDVTGSALSGTSSWIVHSRRQVGQR